MPTPKVGTMVHVLVEPDDLTPSVTTCAPAIVLAALDPLSDHAPETFDGVRLSVASTLGWSVEDSWCASVKTLNCWHWPDGDCP